MKIKTMALAFTAFLAVSFFVLGGKSLAAGSGTQDAPTTLTALTDVNAATNISDVTTAVQNFLNQYSNLTISTNTTQPFTGYIGCGWGTANSLNSGDFSTYQHFGVMFIQEISKYTNLWLVGPLQFDVVSGMGGACTGQHDMLIDVTDGNEDYRGRFTLNHELGHYLLGHSSFMKIDSNTWTGYNPSGFSYNGYNDWANKYSTAEHPINGFVTAYATAHIFEDQAETYAVIMNTYTQTNLATWLSSDSNLVNKVNSIKSFMLSVDPSMDSTYFASIFGYANANDTHYSTPFGGPGTQSRDEQGNILWTIPSSVNTTAGFSVGIVGSSSLKMTAIFDGTVHGGIMPIIEVLQGGTLMGSGSADFIQIDAGGTLAPGHSPGCMSATGSLTISGTYDAEIGGSTACTGYDQMQVTGTVDVTGGTLNTTLYNNYKPKAGEKYTIIDNDSNDAVTGTFSGLAEGATFNLNGNVFKISYVGGDGNDVVLSVVSVPATPNTGIALLKSNPLATLVASLCSAIIILRIARISKAQR
jgi:hypothetical protein